MSFSQRNLAEGRDTSSLKKFVLYASGAAFVFCIALALLWSFLVHSTSSEGTNSETFIIEPGTGVLEIANNLDTQGLITSPFAFTTYVRLQGQSANIQAGTYILSSSMSVSEIAEKLYSGAVTDDEVLLTFIEGWTVEEMQEYLDEESVEMAVQDLSESREMTAIIDSIEPRLLEGAEDVDFFEGYFYPDTYAVFKDDAEVELAQRMVENFANKMTEEHWEAVAESEYSFYELLTLASIIEKEVRTSEERKLAASVFYNRLEIGQGLESDATINYVVGEGRSRATATDLELNSLYNTYKVQGLPPTPISNPSIDAIEAVLFPAESDYFYFLTIPEEQGGTAIFSETFQEHVTNKNLYY